MLQVGLFLTALSLSGAGCKKDAAPAPAPKPTPGAEKPTSPDAPTGATGPEADPTSPALATDAPTTGAVKIVSSLPRTGSANAQTTTIVNGIKMAIDEVGGKVGGLTITYEDWDDASAKKGDWDPEVEANNASKAARDKDILAYIGTYNSGAAKIAMPILNKANLTMISPANTYTGLTKPGTGEQGEPEMYRPTGTLTYFRVVPADDIQGPMGAQWMKEMGATTVYVLDDRGLYGKGLADLVEATAPEIGLKVLGHEGIDPKAQEYRSLMTKIKDLNPDFIYYGGTTQTNAAQLVKDMVAVGLSAKFMVPDGCFEEAFISAAGAENANDRVFVTFGGVPPENLTGKGKDFVTAYQAKFGAMPESYAVYGYVCAKVALDGLKRAGVKDREAVRRAVASFQDTDGPLGKWSFDKNGDTSLELMSGNAVKNGKFEFVKILGQ